MHLRTRGNLAACLFSIGLAIGPAFSNPLEGVKTYGSFAHFEDFPYSLFLLGKIENGDYFELRRAMREHDVEVVVTSSPGGSVFEALQIATAIHDNEIATYVPEHQDFSCASACAFVFFGGTVRAVGGRLGVHQFHTSDGSPLDRARGNIASMVTQYTTGEIIAFLNEFNTPPSVYARMFSTSDIYWFDEVERNELSLDNDDRVFRSRLKEIDAFVDLLVDAFPAREQRLEDDEEPLAATPAPVPDVPRPQPIPPQPVGFSIIHDIDLFGNDILANGIRDIGLSRCEVICQGSNECVAYTYIPETRWCWPKFAVGNMSYKADAVSGIKRGEGIVPAVPISTGYTEFTSKDITGFDLLPEGARNVSLARCREICDAHSDCAGFTWVRDKQWCWPKTFAGPMTDRLGLVSGIKQ